MNRSKGKLNSRIAEFIHNAGYFNQAYNSVRIRTLFANRGFGLEPTTTVIELMDKKYDSYEKIIWKGKMLRVMERIEPFLSIESIIDSVTKGNLMLNNQYVGFSDTEEPYWDYSVISRGDTYNSYFAKSTTIQVNGHLDIKDSPKGYESQFQQEMKLSPQLQVSSLRELTEKLLGVSITDISHKRVEIFAPSYTWLSNLEFYGKQVSFKVVCCENCESHIQFFALFHHDDGSTSIFKPRMRGYIKSSIGNGLIAISKSFAIPNESKSAIALDLTISMDGKIGIDSDYVLNLPVANPTWSIMQSLDTNKIAKYMRILDFENRLSSIKDSDLFESIVLTLMASCGYTPIWTGGFKMSGKDMIVLDDKRHLVLIECTTGSPRDKIGLMKTAVKELKEKLNWLEVHSIVVTSQSVSDAERKDASIDNVLIRDVGDLKTLLLGASQGITEREIRNWLGLDKE